MNKSLVPIEQKQVVFYEDEITAVLVDTDNKQTVYVPIRPICDFLGINWDGQRRRINRDAVLSTEAQGVVVTTTPSEDGRGGGPQEMTCLPLKFIPGWLFGISADRVKEELREKIIRYQRECYDVLSEAFQEGRLTGDVSFSDLLESADPDIVQAYQMAQAIVKLARNQIVMEARLSGRLNVQQGQIEDHGKRLELIEATLGSPDRQITPEQATQISQAVKAIAMVLSKRSGRNEYGGVYGELYRKFGIPSYRELPANKYNEAMNWLREWWQSLTDESVPF